MILEIICPTRACVRDCSTGLHLLSRAHFFRETRPSNVSTVSLKQASWTCPCGRPCSSFCGTPACRRRCRTVDSPTRPRAAGRSDRGGNVPLLCWVICWNKTYLVVKYKLFLLTKLRLVYFRCCVGDLRPFDTFQVTSDAVS